MTGTCRRCGHWDTLTVGLCTDCLIDTAPGVDDPDDDLAMPTTCGL